MFHRSLKTQYGDYEGDKSKKDSVKGRADWIRYLVGTTIGERIAIIGGRKKKIVPPVRESPATYLTNCFEQAMVRSLGNVVFIKNEAGGIIIVQTIGRSQETDLMERVGVHVF